MYITVFSKSGSCLSADYPQKHVPLFGENLHFIVEYIGLVRFSVHAGVSLNCEPRWKLEKNWERVLYDI
jgi:hypothetical protein